MMKFRRTFCYKNGTTETFIDDFWGDIEDLKRFEKMVEYNGIVFEWYYYDDVYNSDIEYNLFYKETDINPLNTWYSKFYPKKELIVCECGKDKHGFASHSRWCPKHEEYKK